MNDHVYCSPSWAVRDGTPYSVARIMEFMPPLGAPIESRETLLYTRVRLAWYYRPSDVSDRPVSDSRLLLAAIYSEVCDINQMRSKCFVVHKDKISDLSGWKKRPDCFYFNRLFDPYIKKEYEIIQSSDVRNLPENIRTTLCSRYEYVVAEKEVIPDLTDSVRLCGTCNDWCPSAETVQCDHCKNFFHMGCVQPPLLAKPSRGYGWTCAPCSRRHEEVVDSRDTRVSTPQPRNRSNAPAVRARGRPRKDRVQAEKEENMEIKHFKMWPFRYFGQYTVAEDTLDEEDLIFPRCGVRFGPKFQATLPAAPDWDKDKPLELDQRGGENTVEVFGWLHDLTEEEDSQLDSCMSELYGAEEYKSTNVDWLSEAVRRFSQTRREKRYFSETSMRTLTRHDRWKKAEVRIFDRDWTVEEVSAFEDAIQAHGPELRSVREEVSTKTIFEVVRFYGRWKNSKLREVNASIQQVGHRPKPVFAQYENALAASKGQQVGTADEGSIIVIPSSRIDDNIRDRIYCGACRVQEASGEAADRWWKAPKGLPTEVLCDNCGQNWRKYADLNVRPVREESLPASRRSTEKRDGTPLAGAPPAKRPRISGTSSRAVTPSPPSYVPILQCSACHQDGPLGKVLKCKKCQFTVHAGTCGAVVKPEAVDSWICDICQNEDALEASLNHSCLLCPPDKQEFAPHPNSGIWRACKPTEGQGWVHVLCAVFMPELTFTDATTLRAVEGISILPSYRWTKKCRLCQSTDGAIIRCNECNREFHTSCAWENDHRLGFEIQPVKSSRRDQTTIVTFNGETGAMSPVLYCKEHDKKRHHVYPICDTNDGGETALQVFARAYRQALVGQAHGLLRKARRLDQVIARSEQQQNGASASHRGRSKGEDSDHTVVDVETRCYKCQTACTPFWHKVTMGLGSGTRSVCHRCMNSGLHDGAGAATQNGTGTPMEGIMT